MNSFQLLQLQQEERFINSPQNDRICNELENSLSLMRFFGAVFNLYLPVMADTIADISSGGKTERTAQPTADNTKKLPPAKPDGPGRIDNNPIR